MADVTPVAGATPPYVETTAPLTAEAGAIAPAVNPLTGESYATADWMAWGSAERARHNERALQPLTFPTTGGVAEAVDAASQGQLDPFYARMKETPVGLRRGVRRRGRSSGRRGRSRNPRQPPPIRRRVWGRTR